MDYSQRGGSMGKGVLRGPHDCDRMDDMMIPHPGTGSDKFSSNRSSYSYNSDDDEDDDEIDILTDSNSDRHGRILQANLR